MYVVARGEEVGRQMGRRLASGLHHTGDGARIALAADQEDSPLQSKRSSMSNFIYTTIGSVYTFASSKKHAFVAPVLFALKFIAWLFRNSCSAPSLNSFVL